MDIVVGDKPFHLDAAGSSIKERNSSAHQLVFARRGALASNLFEKTPMGILIRYNNKSDRREEISFTGSLRKLSRDPTLRWFCEQQDAANTRVHDKERELGISNVERPSTRRTINLFLKSKTVSTTR